MKLLFLCESSRLTYNFITIDGILHVLRRHRALVRSRSSSAHVAIQWPLKFGEARIVFGFKEISIMSVMEAMREFSQLQPLKSDGNLKMAQNERKPICFFTQLTWVAKKPLHFQIHLMANSFVDSSDSLSNATTFTYALLNMLLVNAIVGLDFHLSDIEIAIVISWNLCHRSDSLWSHCQSCYTISVRLANSFEAFGKSSYTKICDETVFWRRTRDGLVSHMHIWFLFCYPKTGALWMWISTNVIWFEKKPLDEKASSLPIDLVNDFNRSIHVHCGIFCGIASIPIDSIAAWSRCNWLANRKTTCTAVDFN